MNRLSILLSATLLAACTGKDVPVDAPTDEVMPEFPAEPSGSEVLQVPTGFDPTATVGMFEVEPKSIRFEDNTVFVEAGLRYAKSMEERPDPVHVGVTVVTPDGEEIDLMVQTLFPGNFDQPVMFTAGVDSEVQDVLIGVWNERVEPCEVDRYGCREFGFVLDGSLASWPEGLYTDGNRQRILPNPVTVFVEGDEASADKAAAAVKEGLQPTLDLFGVKGEVTSEGAEVAAPTTVVVEYAHAHDKVVAMEIAALAGDAVGVDAPTVIKVDAVEFTFKVKLDAP